jgi:hypothetical protein
MSVLALVLAAAQSASAAAAAPTAPTPVPFRVGERFDYVTRWSGFSVGSASIQVAALDTLRNRPVYRLRYTMNAADPLGLYRISSTFESWTTVAGLQSLRFRQDNTEKARRFVRQFEIFPDSASYRQSEPESLPAQSGVAEPLDDASVLYFLRSVPLEIGKTYRFNRYFRADRNPIVVKVLKREVLDLPDGTRAPCLVLNPVVGERGLFSPRAEARLWLTDDLRRIPVQIRSSQPYGQVVLRLQRMILGG